MDLFFCDSRACCNDPAHAEPTLADVRMRQERGLDQLPEFANPYAEETMDYSSNVLLTHDDEIARMIDAQDRGATTVQAAMRGRASRQQYAAIEAREVAQQAEAAEVVQAKSFYNDSVQMGPIRCL